MYTSKLTGYKFKIVYNDNDGFTVDYFSPDGLTNNAYRKHLEAIVVPDDARTDDAFEDRILTSHRELNTVFQKHYHNLHGMPCLAVQINNNIPELGRALKTCRSRSSYVSIQNMSDELLLDVWLDKMNGYIKRACNILELVDKIRALRRS